MSDGKVPRFQITDKIKVIAIVATIALVSIINQVLYNKEDAPEQVVNQDKKPPVEKNLSVENSNEISVGRISSEVTNSLGANKKSEYMFDAALADGTRVIVPVGSYDDKNSHIFKYILVNNEKQSVKSIIVQNKSLTSKDVINGKDPILLAASFAHRLMNEPNASTSEEYAKHYQVFLPFVTQDINSVLLNRYLLPNKNHDMTMEYIHLRLLETVGNRLTISLMALDHSRESDFEDYVSFKIYLDYYKNKQNPAGIWLISDFAIQKSGDDNGIHASY